ncbi:TPA: hypothetical protein PTV68_002493 [Clostridium botulinum]|nr:hypothetical protein [Clostridium botulinum]HDK7188752.1 hypothetical protein [Clostridium botulinum]HDK7215671.1 hypothetical protein [Clostridium botulinum]HDK7231425.1 hypothetical protein [Clostridium botulinum]HDK7261175.1 hypothetical protein [Clostridium botulinum]
MNKSKWEIELDKKIEAQNKRIMGYAINIFISMVTSIVFTLLLLKAIGSK